MPNGLQTIGLVERILQLRKLAPLADLPAAADLNVLAGHLREGFFPKGSVLMREDEPVSALQLVVDGMVRCTRSGRVLGDIGPGDGAVGGLAIFAQGVRTIEARAVTDVLTLEMDADTLREILEDRFTITQRVMKDVCGQLVDTLARNPTSLSQAPVIPRPLTIPDQDLNLVERLLFLRQSPVFERTSLNALAVLSRAMVESSFSAGETLWRVGEPSAFVLMIASGSATAAFPDGAQISVGSGTPLGAVESQAGRPRWYTATADTKLVALRSEAQTLLDVMEDNVEVALDFLTVVSRWMLMSLENSPGGDVGPFFGVAQSPSGPPAQP
jgi:CRP/FNR family transcriptional regulator, cyclic AMP receptor protein